MGRRTELCRRGLAFAGAHGSDANWTAIHSPRHSGSSGSTNGARRVSGFRFRLYSAEWDELGEFETIVPNWSQGDEFATGDGRRLRIVRIVGVPDDVRA